MFFAKNVRRAGKGAQGNYFFRRKRKKVQVELRHNIDLNPETPASRRQKRLRTAGVGVKVAAALLFAMGLFSAGKIVIKEAFIDNKRFELQHVSVKTDGKAGLTVPQIMSVSGLHEGMNMLSVSLVKLKDDLEALPQVKKAKVTRGYPGILFIEVEQREPVAWLECEEKNMEANVADYGGLLDAEGYVLPSNDNVSQQKLPVIEVATLDKVVPGQKVGSSAVKSALHFLQHHESSALNNTLQVVRIKTAKDYALDVQYHTNVEVTFPRYGVETQLLRLDRIMQEATKHEWQLASINLLVEQNVPVTFQTALAETNPDKDYSKPAVRRNQLARAN